MRPSTLPSLVHPSQIKEVLGIGQTRSHGVKIGIIGGLKTEKRYSVEMFRVSGGSLKRCAGLKERGRDESATVRFRLQRTPHLTYSDRWRTIRLLPVSDMAPGAEAVLQPRLRFLTKPPQAS